MGHATLFQLDAHYRFFNTETGNFALFWSADATELVVAEVITTDEFTALPWRGLRFSGTLHTRTPLQLRGLTCFFDAALTLPESLLPQAALYALDQSAPWNTAVLDCHYDAAYEVMFKSDTLHLQGLCFRQDAFYDSCLQEFLFSVKWSEAKLVVTCPPGYRQFSIFPALFLL